MLSFATGAAAPRRWILVPGAYAKAPLPDEDKLCRRQLKRGNFVMKNEIEAADKAVYGELVMEDRFKGFSVRPGLWERSAEPFWDGEHISKDMLEAHLNPMVDAASRKKETNDR